jgi:muconolactone delta-isomerase
MAMEYLVTMTTHVPDGTREEEVDEVRSREAAHSRELAAAGQLLRLWRPPLRPGEWRTFGLFAADDSDRLEKILASMPLRIWRTDEVTPLSPHANDPVSWTEPDENAREFFTIFTLRVPEGTPWEMVEDTKEREAHRAAELGAQGHLVRLWRLPGEDRALGLWRAHDDAQLRTILTDLPLAAWMTVETTPLDRHPSDPVTFSEPHH